MSNHIKSAVIILALVTALTISSLIVVAQLTYAQQGSSTNPNFRVRYTQHGDAPPRYQVAIPITWVGPSMSQQNSIYYFQSADARQSITIWRIFPGMYTIEQLINSEIQNLASQGKRLDQDVQTSWQGHYPARILIYPDRISIWISAWTRFLNISADGAVVNDQTINQILNSFQIQNPNAAEQQLISYENDMFYCTAMKALSTFPGSNYDVRC